MKRIPFALSHMESGAVTRSAMLMHVGLALREEGPPDPAELPDWLVEDLKQFAIWFERDKNWILAGGGGGADLTDLGHDLLAYVRSTLL